MSVEAPLVHTYLQIQIASLTRMFNERSQAAQFDCKNIQVLA